MAAGVGSRFGGLKQLEPIGPSGEIILDYSIHDALAAGWSKVVFVIRERMARDFREVLGRHIESLVETRYVHQELDRVPEGFQVPADREKPWGTGHAVLCCRDEIDGPFAVINADDFYGRESFARLGSWLDGARDDGPIQEYCMVGFVLGNTLSSHGHVSRGVCAVTPGGLLSEIREHTHIEIRDGRPRSLGDDGTWTDLPIDAVVSMNTWGFTPGIFDALEARFARFLRERGGSPRSELYLPSAVMDMLATGEARVSVVPTAERWVGVTHREDLAGVRRTIRALVDAGVYPHDLRAR
jgi:dTDP-glucose pyrophosphorylase